MQNGMEKICIRKRNDRYGSLNLCFMSANHNASEGKIISELAIVRESLCRNVHLFYVWSNNYYNSITAAITRTVRSIEFEQLFILELHLSLILYIIQMFSAIIMIDRKSEAGLTIPLMKRYTIIYRRIRHQKKKNEKSKQTEYAIFC
uniref:Uncharacterized protein n=1 Tax=Onchocerca volvulus TaxID=6282 RepID=A0A8R1XXP8_ONCVO